MNLGVQVIFINLLLSFFLVSTPESIEKETKSNLVQEADEIYLELALYDLPFETFLLAYEGYSTLLNQQALNRDSILTVIDYSRPSDQERLYVFDLKNRKLMFKSLVAHGKGSGERIARSFSNQPASHKSSLGFFITGNPYNGKHGYSLQIEGIEKGINNNAKSRAIVFHGASYVSLHYIAKNGRLGRSFGCPALPLEISRPIIDSIKDSSCVFIYAPDKIYFLKTNLISSSMHLQTIAQ